MATNTEQTTGRPHRLASYTADVGERVIVGPVSYTHLTLPTTPYV